MADGIVVVAFGASAGGLDAFRTFLSAMPPDSGLAFVLAHEDPHQASVMPQLLGPHTAMRVQEAADGMSIAPDHVYVAPPSAMATVHDGVFRLSKLAEPREHRAAMDALFRTLAEDSEQRAVAVVLSGSGHDGAIGLKAVREHGGLTIAQHPATAHHPEMPRHAIATGLVHHVLAVRDMPAVLLEHARRLLVEGERGRLLEEEIAARLPEICALLLERTGHDFRQYKRTTLLRRVQHRARVLRATSAADYLALLRREGDEPVQLVRDLLIGVTEFFRDPDTFEVVRQELVPALFAERGADRPIRVWVPGCATGEEVYTIAMLLTEHIASLPAAPRVQIFGTDVDDQAIESARRGRYAEEATQHVSPERLARFFVAEEGGARSVTKEIRDLCVFSRHDLVQDPPFSRLDLISCRNVLIYLEGELQRRVLGVFHYALVEGGYLLLGPSESVSQRSELFRAVDGKRRIFQKKRGALHAPARPPFAERGGAERRAGEASRGPWPPDQSIERTIERRLLERYGPPCVVVNEQGDIVYLSGETGKYLAPSTGALDVNVSSMVLRALRPEVRSAVHRAVRMREQVVHENIAVETIAGTQRLNLVVRPLGDLEDELGLFVVLFDELRPAARGEAPPPGPRRESASLVDQLEHELKATREHLQTTIEELETSNEELKSSNEELLSMNEELQSLNQEFEALNAELKAKIEQLDAANSDLQNLLLSTQIPTVFLDEELRIRRFTPAATGVFRLIEGDVGRPILDIAARFDASSLVPDAREVLRTLAPREREVHLDDGRCCYMMRILPYRTLANVISGVVVTLLDVTSLKEAELQRGRLAAIVESAEQAILGATVGGAITTWNAAAERMFGYSEREALDRPVHILVAPERADELRAVLERVAHGERVDPIETVGVARGGGRVDVSINLAPIHDAAGKIIGASAMVNDITRRKQVEADLIAAREAAEHANRTKDQFLAVLSHELRTPLTPIVTAASRLLRRDDLPEDARRGVEMIQRNAELEARLIDDLLDLTRVVRGKLELVTQTIAVRAVLDHAMEICADEIDAKSIRLTLDVAPGDHWVSADVARLEQVVWNLLKNAVKFSHPGSQIALRCHEQGGQVVIEVRDEGIGIEPEVLPRIFDAFEQGDAATARHFGGLGLGLAISRAIVQLHGGSITASSAGRGAGATFRVCLPAARPPAAVAPARARSAGAVASRRPLRILLVEDHEDTAEMMSELLTLTGHAVRIARSVRAALDLAGAEAFDLLVSDLGLPDGSGMELLESLRSAGNAIRAIALSGYGMEEDRRKTTRVGFLEHLIKPVSFRDLEAAIQRVMAAP
ncbi:CheR family methyltransferase [Sorangium sp. So ce315]|uniref:CheR family methyltransferase n=1 Tax=Sorangium sp. So ce315 TaxID=3133299 RepID=UPI003F631FB3